MYLTIYHFLRFCKLGELSSDQVGPHPPPTQGNDLNSLMAQAKFTALLAKIHERNNNLDAAIRALTETKDIRSRIVKRVQVEQPDGIEEQRQLAAKVCHQVAEFAMVQRNFDGAIQQYKESLSFYPEDEVGSLAIWQGCTSSIPNGTKFKFTVIKVQDPLIRVTFLLKRNLVVKQEGKFSQ